MLVEDIHILHLYQIHEKSCLCVIYGKGTLLFMKLCKAFLSPSLKYLMKATQKKGENETYWTNMYKITAYHISFNLLYIA